MNHDRHPGTEALSAYLEGDLSDVERESVADHVDRCDRCRDVLEDLRRIVRNAGGLEDRPPPSNLWPAILERIKVEGAPGAPSRIGPRPAPARSIPPGPDPYAPRTLLLRRVPVRVPWLAAAAVVLMFASGATAWLVRPAFEPAAREPFPVADVLPVFEEEHEMAPEGYETEVAELQRILRESRDRLEPATVRVLEKNLEVIDRAIRESRTALEVDPGNSYLEGHLRRAYRKKLEYLRDVARVAEWST